MAQAKRIYILMIKVNRLFSKRNRKHVLCVSTIYRVIHVKNASGSLGELEKAVETLVCVGLCFHSISRSPKLPLLFLYLDRYTGHVFCILLKKTCVPQSYYYFGGMEETGLIFHIDGSLCLKNRWGFEWILV